MFVPKLAIDQFNLKSKEILSIAQSNLTPLNPIIIKPNYANINWDKLVYDSVWKNPPFEEKNEKGFKDRMIIESIKNFLEMNPTETIFFICDDNKLIEGLTQILDTLIVRVKTIHSFSEFIGNTFNLYQESLGSKQVQSITKNAKLLLKRTILEEALHKAKEMVRTDYPEILTDAIKTRDAILPSDYSNSEYIPISAGVWKISDVLFVKKEDRKFTWLTTLALEQDYHSTYHNGIDIRVWTEFNFEWSTTLNESGRLVNPQIVNFNMGRSMSIPISDSVENTESEKGLVLRIWNSF